MTRDITDQDGPDRPDDVLAAEYVLHLLDAEDRAAVDARLDVDGALRARVVDWSERLVLLADDIDPVTPPPAIRETLTRFADDQTAEQNAAPRTRGFGGFAVGKLFAGLLGGGAIAALAVIVLTVTLPNVQPPADGTLQYAAAVTAENQSLVIQARYDPSSGVLTITRESGAAPEGRSLQMWLLTEDQPPHSVGLLPETGALSVPVIPFWGTRIPSGQFAVSEEPPDGSPLEVPSGAVLAVGQVQEL